MYLFVDCGVFGVFVFFFKQKTAYERRISDWSSDVCSSDLGGRGRYRSRGQGRRGRHRACLDQPGLCRTQACRTRRCSVPPRAGGGRSEERRVGKECVSTGRSRGSPTNKNTKNIKSLEVVKQVTISYTHQKNICKIRN